MEYYSERCSDWLDKNPHIHPDKLAMEIRRFQSMLDQLDVNTDGSCDERDDLQLTVQLLTERMDILLPQEQTSTPSAIAHHVDNSPTTISTAPSANSAESYSLSVDDSSEFSWDSASLTGHGQAHTEILDAQTKAARKAQLLGTSGIQLGTKGLKSTAEKSHNSDDS